jgi:hypothetical protein
MSIIRGFGATYSFSMLIVGAHSWLRRRWKSGQQVNPNVQLKDPNIARSTYASCRPFRSNRDGLVDVVSRCHRMESGQLEACVGNLRCPRFPRHVQAAFGCWLRTLIDVGAVMVLFVELAHVEFIGSENAMSVPDHRPYHDHPDAFCACRHG